MKLTGEVLKKRIRGYLSRASTDKNARKYPLQREGLYAIVGGQDDRTMGGLMLGTRKPGETVEGRFIDVLSYALNQSWFYADWISERDMACDLHGYIQIEKFKKLKPGKSLDSLLTRRRKRK